MCSLALALFVALPALIQSDRRVLDKAESALALSVESGHFEQQKSESGDVPSGFVPGKLYLCTEKWEKSHLFSGSTGHRCLIDEDQALTMAKTIKAMPDKDKPKFYVSDASFCAAKSKSKSHLLKVCPLKDNNRVSYSHRIFVPKSCFRSTPATWHAHKVKDDSNVEVKLVASALDEKGCKSQVKLQVKYQGRLRRIKKGGDNEDEDLIEEDEVEARDEDNKGDEDEEEGGDDAPLQDTEDDEMSFEDRVAMWKKLDQEALAKANEE